MRKISKKDLSGLRKNELIDLVLKLDKTSRDLEALLKDDTKKSSKDKKTLGISVYKTDEGGYCTALVRFSKPDVVEEFHFPREQPHMADFTAKKLLAEKIIKQNQGLE